MEQRNIYNFAAIYTYTSEIARRFPIFIRIHREDIWPTRSCIFRSRNYASGERHNEVWNSEHKMQVLSNRWYEDYISQIRYFSSSLFLIPSISTYDVREIHTIITKLFRKLKNCSFDLIEYYCFKTTDLFKLLKVIFRRRIIQQLQQFSFPTNFTFYNPFFTTVIFHFSNTLVHITKELAKLIDDEWWRAFVIDVIEARRYNSPSYLSIRMNT